MEHRCETCAFLDISVIAGDDDEKAQCRRSAPAHDDRTGAAVWPLVDRDEDWCGEHSALQVWITTRNPLGEVVELLRCLPFTNNKDADPGRPVPPHGSGP